MPSYTFRCQICGEVFTRRYSFHDDLSTVTCPNGHREVERVFVPPAVVFKGSGFYITDHGRSNGKQKGMPERGKVSPKKTAAQKSSAPSSVAT
jgi:putative FmdB family regulatory protein